MAGDTRGTEKQGGVIHIQMRCPFDDDGVMGWLDVAVTPSNVIANHTGVYFQANHHHQPTPHVPEKTEDPPSEVTGRLLACLTERFEGSIAQSESIFEEVLAL